MSYKLTILGCSSVIPSLEKNPTGSIAGMNDGFLIDCGRYSGSVKKV